MSNEHTAVSLGNEHTFISLGANGKMGGDYDRVIFHASKGVFYLFLVKTLETGQALRVAEPGALVGTINPNWPTGGMRYRRITEEPAAFTTDDARTIYSRLVDEGIATEAEEVLPLVRAARSER